MVLARRIIAVVFFEVVGEIKHIQTIAAGTGIRQLARLRKVVWSRALAQDER